MDTSDQKNKGCAKHLVNSTYIETAWQWLEFCVSSQSAANSSMSCVKQSKKLTVVDASLFTGRGILLDAN
jgi:hypothetical protein